MPVQAIRAILECDECGIEFSVAIEEDKQVPVGWSMWDVAHDAVRGGLEYREPRDAPRRSQQRHTMLPSVQDGLVLCADCTAVRDAQEEKKSCGIL